MHNQMKLFLGNTSIHHVLTSLPFTLKNYSKSKRSVALQIRIPTVAICPQKHYSTGCTVVLFFVYVWNMFRIFLDI